MLAACLSSGIDLLIDLLQQSELSSLAEVEFPAELINNFFWQLAFIDFDVLDVFSSIQFDLQNTDWLLIFLNWKDWNSWLHSIVWTLVWHSSVLSKMSRLWHFAFTEWVWCVWVLVWTQNLIKSLFLRLSSWRNHHLWLVSVSINHLGWNWRSWLSWFSQRLLNRCLRLNESSWESLLLNRWVIWSLLNWSLNIDWLWLGNDWSRLSNNSSDWLLNNRSQGWLGVLSWQNFSWLSSGVGFLSWKSLSHYLLLRGIWLSNLSDWESWHLFWELIFIHEHFFFFQIFLFSIENSSLSIFSHVVEFLMNQFDLSICEAVGLSINKTLNCGELVNKNKLLVLSVEVDRIEISVKELVIQEIMASLLDLQIKDGAADFEKVLANVILFTLVCLQVRRNEQILLWSI